MSNVNLIPEQRAEINRVLAFRQQLQTSGYEPLVSGSLNTEVSVTLWGKGDGIVIELHIELLPGPHQVAGQEQIIFMSPTMVTGPSGPVPAIYEVPKGFV